METKTIYKPNITQTDRLYFTPDEVATNWLAYAQQQKAEIERGDGLTWGVKDIDAVVRPLGLGKIWAILARPGHGKSTSAMYLARRYAQTLVANGNTDEIVLYVTVDQPIEELETMVQSAPGITTDDVFWGRANIETMKQKAIRRVNLPIWFMGRSIVERRTQPKMTAEHIYEQVRQIETKYRKHPALIVIDYIQNMPVEGGKRTRTDEVTEAVVNARDLVLELQTRMIHCVQASRSVDDRDYKIPQIGDCQHASAIEQDVDAIFGVWRPILTETQPLEVERDGRKISLPITDNLFILGNGKQRGGKPARTFYLHFDPVLVRLSDLELKQ